MAAAIRIDSGASARLWPWMIAYAVDWHNSAITSVGSSTADANISPHQRFTLRPPRVMDLASFGCRAVVLLAPTHQHKPSLSGRGQLGAFLGRSRHSKGSYDILVEGNKIVTSSSVMVDEEYFDLAPPELRFRPLTAVAHAAPPAQASLLPPQASIGSDVSGVSTYSLIRSSFLNLFSGPYARADGLLQAMKSNGWLNVVQIDNDGEKGGGWQHDLLNDALFASLMTKAKAGTFGCMMIAFPCSSSSIARFFDATNGKGGDKGPPIIRNFTFPDGLPEDQIDPKHVRELKLSNLLLERTVDLAIAARLSLARTTIIFENPADRSPGASIASSPEFAEHGSIFQTTAFKRLVAEAGLTGQATFAYCRLAPDGPQKYTTVYYTPEAGSVLDELNNPEFQCNHERGTHAKRAGGRSEATGEFVSAEAAPYPRRLNTILSKAFTVGRTGGSSVVAPPSIASQATARDSEQKHEHQPLASTTTGEPSSIDGTQARPTWVPQPPTPSSVAPSSIPGTSSHQKSSPTSPVAFPNLGALELGGRSTANLKFEHGPAIGTSKPSYWERQGSSHLGPDGRPKRGPPPSRSSGSGTQQGPTPEAASPLREPLDPVREDYSPSGTAVGSYTPFNVSALVSELDRRDYKIIAAGLRRLGPSLIASRAPHDACEQRSVARVDPGPQLATPGPQLATPKFNQDLINLLLKATEALRSSTREAGRQGSSPVGASTSGTPAASAQPSPRPRPTSPNEPSRTPNTFTPSASAASVMSAAVAESIFDACVKEPTEEMLPISDWALLTSAPPAGTGKRLPGGARMLEMDVSIDHREEGLEALLVSMNHALRADSPDAPSTHAEAMRNGDIWIPSEKVELDNHERNESWVTITRDQLPAGRRVHKLIWVYKMKRDGTAKSRLCVQGTTLEANVDYQQVFSAALRHSSARALFAYAARNSCRVRSVDLVAAYLQGRFIDGEVVYTHLPPGYPEFDDKGRPKLAKILKPIYGIQQAGRRLQRMLFEWLKHPDRGFKSLDDSDPCIFTLKTPDGEILTMGVYVDNLQIVHSVELDDKGRGPEGCAYNKFMDQITADWDVVDEGPMEDLLGIEVEHNDNGSITLHQRKYIEKIVQRFLPDGPIAKAQRNSLPYSDDFLSNINEALSRPDVDYPELVLPMQERIGCLMYATTSSRPDIAYAVHQLCKVMHRPTPALLAEINHLLTYLSRTASLGLTYESEPDRLVGFADSSWEAKTSTSGWVVSWQKAALTWGSRKQKSIALSTCEAEIIALSEASKDVVYLRKLVKGLGAPEETPSSLSTDSTCARAVSYNPEHHDKMKHVERRHFYVRDMVEKFELEVPYVPTKENPADFFTKPMKNAAQFREFRNRIMNIRD